MTEEFLTPVSEELRIFASELDIFSIGSSIGFENEVVEKSVVIIGVYYKNPNPEHSGIDSVRKELYRLKKGNWHMKVYDLGNLFPGNTPQDTNFAFIKIQQEILKKKCTLIIVGDDSALAYWQFRALDTVNHKVNLSCIDNRFRLGNDSDELSGYNYLSKIITTEPHTLFEYTHLGHQTYFVAQEELDLMEELNFEVKRLGLLTQETEEAEPELRNSDVVILNLDSIQSSDFQSNYEPSPNGFNSREICKLARYSGINNKVRSIGVYNFKAKNILSDNLLTAEILWYFIEGRNNSVETFDFENSNCETYHVQLPEQDLTFHRVMSSDQWWIELDDFTESDAIRRMIPCSAKDYQDALKGRIPNRWWKAYKKLY